MCSNVKKKKLNSSIGLKVIPPFCYSFLKISVIFRSAIFRTTKWNFQELFSHFIPFFRAASKLLTCHVKIQKFNIFAVQSYDVTFPPKPFNLKIKRHAIVSWESRVPLSCKVFAQTAFESLNMADINRQYILTEFTRV